jgi:flagellar hook protein FlgE
MSLTGALSSAISALSAQSQSLAMISDNIANSQTSGYKTNTAMFEDLVTGSSSASSYSSGGVTSSARANITQQGLLTTTTNATDVAIQGNGFFPVTTSLTGGTQLYTRDGAFTIDNSGFLVSNGSYLLGEPTDASGAVSGALQPINTDIAPTNQSATTETTFAANLPADAASGATFTSSMSVYDSQGIANTVPVTWTKSTTATNTWTASFGAPTLASDSSVTTGAVSSGGSVSITFNSDGSLATPTAAPTLGITWTNGAAASTINLNLGTVGKSDGLTQLASGATTPAIDVTSITSDGVARGQLSSVAVGANGAVNATYSNGKTVQIYKIQVALFAAPEALQAQSGGLYSATVASGSANFKDSGQDGAGKIYGSELESSTTDTNTEFSSMISAQQAYSAASQVITAVNKMFDTLISSMR